MKPSVLLFVILSVVVVASAFTLPEEILDDEALQLSERRFKGKNVVKAVAKTAAKVVVKTVLPIPSFRPSRELADESVQTSGFAAGSEAVELRDIQSPEQYQVEDDSVVLPEVDDNGCKRECVTLSIDGCSEWRVQCKRSQITDEDVDSPSIQNMALRQQASKKPVARRPTADCRACLKTKIVPSKCKMCPKRFQPNLKIAALSAANDGDEQDQQIAVHALEDDSVRAYRVLYDEPVVKAEKYQMLEAGEVAIKDAVFAVVVTLKEGDRVTMLQGVDVKGAEESTVLLADKTTAIGENWKLIETKDVKFSKVADYVRASDSSTDTVEAVDRMMALD